MKARVGQLVGGVIEGMPWLGTFHSLSVQHPAPPRRAGRAEVELHHPRHRRPAPPAPPDHPGRQHRREALAAAAARRPDRRLEEPRAARPSGCPRSEASAFDHRGAELYAEYQERLRTLNACDFGDLLLHVVDDPADTTPTCSPSYQRWFRYILVDEYQDTNVAQYLWLRLLAGAHRNICCVGDDDQSIYGWRGAEVGNILRFEKDFPGAQGDPPRAELPLDPAHPRRRLRRHRRQREPPRQDPLDRHRRGREGPPDRPLGRRGGGALDRRGDRGARPRHPRPGPDPPRRHRHPRPRLATRCAPSRTAS